MSSTPCINCNHFYTMDAGNGKRICSRCLTEFEALTGKITATMEEVVDYCNKTSPFTVKPGPNGIPMVDLG